MRPVAGHRGLDVLGEHLAEDVLLRGEVAVERADAAIGALRDVDDGRALEPAVLEERG